jgi:hypothetical protein
MLEAKTLTPTLSRKREKEFSLPPLPLAGEGWGEGVVPKLTLKGTTP